MLGNSMHREVCIGNSGAVKLLKSRQNYENPAGPNLKTWGIWVYGRIFARIPWRIRIHPHSIFPAYFRRFPYFSGNGFDPEKEKVSTLTVDLAYVRLRT